MSRRPLADSEWLAVFHDFEHTAFRLELQPAYAVAAEDELYASWRAGHPIDPLSVPAVAEWVARISEHVTAGRRVERVRVQEDPPTEYQRWERWLDPVNRKAGEVMRYMTRAAAYDIGLLPAADDMDWWLLDSSRLIVMRFDEDGRPIERELITDPAVVVQACAWRDLAVHHSVRAEHLDAAA